MLGQVRLLSVTFTAVLANVRFEVFRLLVLWNVLEERRLVDEALVARVALVRFVGLVAARVRLEIGELGEGFGAAWVPTAVRLVAGVSPDVLLEMRELREFALTDFASVGLDAQMNSRVLREVGGVGEALGALRALVRLGLAHVDLGVELQVRL